MIVCVSVFSLFALMQEISGHGMVLDPPNRSSLWRFNSAAAANYDDNQNFCGGSYVQWELNNGKCGLCGDSYTDAHPQPNENTGKYGQGIIARNYSAGSIIHVEVLLTKNHLGSFQFSLCELKDVNAPEPNEECFETLSLADGSTQLPILAGQTNINVAVQLPENKTCERCVLRWHYRSGNNWGDCGDGTYGMGCGVQETFRTCSDITIV